MDIILFKIGPIAVYTHGFFVVLAVIASSLIFFYLAKKEKNNYSFIYDVVLYTIIFGIIGARVCYYILYQKYFSSFWQIFEIWQGGLVSWGGFVAGALTFIILLKVLKKPVLKWFDLLAISSLLGISIGRLGCFFSREYAGIAGNGIFSYHGIVPVTLHESIWSMIVFFSLLIIYKKFNSVIRPGVITFEAIMLYSIGKFAIDFWRDEPNIIWQMNLSQITSLVAFLLSLMLLALITFGRTKSKGA